MATRFWVGGTGTWDNTTTTHWAATTGGAGGATVPAAADSVTFDGASGGGVVTVAATINGTNTVQSIICGAFTGTLDFATNNPSVTTQQISISGAGTRTINLGSGTFVVNLGNANSWDAGTTTGLTFNAGTSTISVLDGGFLQQTFVGGGLTYSTVSFGSSTTANVRNITGSSTFANLSIAGPLKLSVTSGTTQTVTGALSINGVSNGLVEVNAITPATPFTFTCTNPPTISWAALGGVTFATSAATANNSFDMKNNNMNGGSIVAPSIVASGGGIIGS